MNHDEMFDFGDGRGPVPAHRHPNGGGLVAETARVALTAYVGPSALVYERASVEDYAHVLGGRVHGHARVRDSAEIYDGADVGGCARVQDYARVFGTIRGFAWALDNYVVQPHEILEGNAVGLYER